MPARAGRLVVGLAVLVLVGGGALFVRYWSAERAGRQAVELSASLGVVSSSTSRPGGEVRFYLLVRNDGGLPVSVTSVAGADAGLRLRMRDDGARGVAPGAEIEVPLSVRVTCAEGTGAAGTSFAGRIGVRREDGVPTSRAVDLRRAGLVRDVAATVCAVRPDLRDHELSGPALRIRASG